MRRYFAAISYLGTRFAGWQKQPNADSVQQTVEKALSTLLHTEVKVVGCGRTDAGVHARNYVLHFDTDPIDPPELTYRLNKFLPPDITFHHIAAVVTTAHARFDANYRAYTYWMHCAKDPFIADTSYHYPFFNRLDRNKIQLSAKLLLEYDAFLPFCKTGSDAKTMNCELHRSEWIFEDDQRMAYHIAANRFLRGMVRLITGMCLNVGLGKLSLQTVRQSLDRQQPLPKSYSVPPHGLCLHEIRYPYSWKEGRA